MPKKLDLAGQRFGKLVVIKETNERRSSFVVWECLCDCGKTINVPSGYLRIGDTKTCGKCLENVWQVDGNICKCEVKKQNGESIVFIIDIEDYEKLKNFKWYISHGYPVTPVKNKNNIPIHRYLLNPNDDMDVDHINHNTLDNRRINLRICTTSQNVINKCMQSNNTTSNIGIWWDKRTNRWAAEISVNKKKYFLGRFKIKEEAIEARNKATIKYHGEYAYREAE